MSECEFNIKEVFESAVTIVKNLPKEGPFKPSDSLKLKLYALFKQATHGPNDTPKPKFYQIVESYKWDAWRRLGDMSREDAMADYISKLKQIMDTIPPEEANAVDKKQFQDILGKKFYDYWFDEWERKLQDNLLDPNLITDRSGDLSIPEEAKSVEADGYKTPMGECNITCQMKDQLSQAVLRLQQNLDETNSRLNRLESQANTIRTLDIQTRVSSQGPGFWFYLSYPLLVFFAFRALERRQRQSKAAFKSSPS